MDEEIRASHLRVIRGVVDDIKGFAEEASAIEPGDLEAEAAFNAKHAGTNPASQAIAAVVVMGEALIELLEDASKPDDD